MSFSSNVKEELIRQPLGKSCCTLAELSALTQTSGTMSFRGGGRVRISWRVDSVALARRIFRLLRARLSVTPAIHFVQRGPDGAKRTCALSVDDADARKLLVALGMMEQQEDGEAVLTHMTPHHSIARQCCCRAFLRGAFLGSGTMSAPDKGYHLEWKTDDLTLRQSVARALEKNGLPVHEHLRRERHVTYLKGAQQISDTLAIMGATGSMLDMENTRIRKQLRRDANRAGNCDMHNTERMVSAAQRQLDAIRLITIQQGLDSLPMPLRQVARLRLENTEMSLVELGQMMTPPLGKSGVNYRMERIMELAEKLQPRQKDTEEGTP